jgi:hypothetical protein
MKTKFVAALLAAAAIGFPAYAGDPVTVELKDGGKLVVDKDGKTYHADAKGKRVRMKDGQVMEGKDGAKYLMKNDAIWKDITSRGTPGPR